MSKRPYLFYFLGYDRSNGIRVMMILSRQLADRGYDVRYYVTDKSNWSQTNLPIQEVVDERMRNEAIVVYPEIVAGNPLRVRNVARLVLFYPGRNGGMKRYHKSELLFAYRPEFYPGIDVLTIPWIDSTLFNDPGYTRTQDYCFVYKGGRWCDPPELKDLPTITMKWPDSREKLADLMKHARNIYSFDAESALLDEAICCGAKPFIVTKSGFIPYKSSYADDAKRYPRQLENFIQKTQAANFTGKIQSKYLICYWAYAVWRYWIKPHLSKKN